MFKALYLGDNYMSIIPMNTKANGVPFKLDELMIKLLTKEPFFANLIYQCKIKYDHPEIRTAAATFEKYTPVIFINRNFMSMYTQDQQVAVLKHEVLHLLLGHVQDARAKGKHMQVWNYAVDCAINQYIENIPEKMWVFNPESKEWELGGSTITLSTLRKMLNQPNLEALQAAEYYYEKLMEKGKENFEKNKSMGSVMDIHEDIPDSGEGTEEGQDTPGQGSLQQEQMKAAAKDMLSKALKQTSPGSVPGDLVKAFDFLFQESSLSWKSMLRNFVASATSSKRKATRKKPHRRFGLEVPGYKKHRELKVAYCMDTSGSVSEEQFNSGVSEMINMLKSGMISELHVIYADCKVNKVIKVDKVSKVPYERHGYGGTAYQPAIDKAKEIGCDAIIYFGDMDTADTPENPYIPFMWLTVGSTEKPGDFGLMVELK
jgi:predicted metal-dependent peptidase